ncbi:MAG: hypothetical protein IT164_15400 [Bryobacterales bacterium]|nr:hypothetical protein [Bryobacterales bacterium]
MQASGKLLLVVCVGGCGLHGQAPVIAPDGVVHAAIYYSWDGRNAFSSMLVPGGLIRIRGHNLASGAAQARGMPLPSSLLGTQVAIDGVSAPLSCLSPRRRSSCNAPAAL